MHLKMKYRINCKRHDTNEIRNPALKTSRYVQIPDIAEIRYNLHI